MAEKLMQILKKTASKISADQADAYEIFGLSSTETDIEAYDAHIESLSFSDSSGMGIRIIKNGAVGYAFTSFLGEEKIMECIQKAAVNARATTGEDLNLLPGQKDYLYKHRALGPHALYDEKFHHYSTEHKTDAAKKLEEITIKKDKRITGVSSASYHDSDVKAAIINSAGFRDHYRKSACYMVVNAIAKQKEDTSTGYYFGFGKHMGQICLEDIAAHAAKRSVALLGAQKIQSKKVDILLDPLVGSQFLGVIADALTADSVQKGKSLFADRVGEKLFSIDLDIYDDGTMAQGLASAPFDGEGVYKGKTAVFAKGILKTYLYNTYTARKDGTQSTGNASRFSYRSVPSVGVSNFYMSGGKDSFQTLLSGMHEGFYVMDIIGLHSGANAVTGDISVGAKGLWVKNGDFTHAVKEVTIATNFLDFMKSISKTGDTLTFIPSQGFIGSPALLVKDMMVSGT